jgi:hypothetical protein
VSPHLQALAGPAGQIKWVEIPSFQRGISWDIEKVKDLLQSSSILLGNAILSQFNVAGGQFPNLPGNQNHYLVLVDGLQRLAVGTAILTTLHNDVLGAQPRRPADAAHFTALAARVAPLSAYYLHNDSEFANHPRQAVRDQYIVLRKAISDYCSEELVQGRAGQLATAVVPLFLTRQVALDIYFNFERRELLGTFIGINTVRVDLGPVDLLRASILERATVANWTQAELEIVENEFTDTLTEAENPKQNFMPFVNAALKAINDGFGSRLFASWDIGLKKQDVDEFLTFIDDFETAALSNTYLAEIQLCGKLPVSMAFAYYYLDYLHGSKTKPPFFSGAPAADAELHAYLIACYRLLIDGSIGRTGDSLGRLIDGSTVVSLSALADTLSVNFVGRSIATSLDPQWLETHLASVDQKKAPRIFNAMMLPLRATRGAAFAPLTFGRRARDFHVDHLIPESLLSLQMPGGLEGETLRNFAPLPTNQNRVAKATSCSAKLGAGGIYAIYCAGHTHKVHPYSKWLTANVPRAVTTLDNQAHLEKNSNPDIGSQRIAHIASELLARI